MALSYENLDERTRDLMLSEVQSDIESGKLYISQRLTDAGKEEYPKLLIEAVEKYDDAWLANTLRTLSLLKSHEQKRKSTGGYTTAKVPVTAPDTLAEGEFNRFYCRGVCRRAIDEGLRYVIVYRAKEVSRPRPESEAKINQSFDAAQLLDDLRSHQGEEPALGIPRPNSGLSVRLP